VGQDSPYGRITFSRQIADGIDQFETRTACGLLLFSERNALVPEAARNAGGWYTYDVDFAIVALCFPGDLGPSDATMQLVQRRVLERDRPAALAAIDSMHGAPCGKVSNATN
jgi:hypothetical protein